MGKANNAGENTNIKQMTDDRRLMTDDKFILFNCDTNSPKATMLIARSLVPVKPSLRIKKDMTPTKTGIKFEKILARTTPSFLMPIAKKVKETLEGKTPNNKINFRVSKVKEALLKALNSAIAKTGKNRHIPIIDWYLVIVKALYLSAIFLTRIE
jgi:hypothetical protein